MKKIAFLVLLFCSFYVQLSAQQIKLSETVYKMGFMYQFYTFNPTDSLYSSVLGQYSNFMLGGYLPFAHKNDVVSVGVDAGLVGGINFRNGISYQIQLPVFAMGKLGANSTIFNEQRIGIAAGIGGMFSFLNQKQGSIPTKIFVFNPSGVVEVGLGGLIGRIQFSLLPYKTAIHNFDSPLSDNRWKVSSIGLGLIYRM